jgi:hypothetical protein
MSFVDATRSVERQTFFDGQRLFAADLQAIEGFDREMRWLHNRSLHQPGVGNGFAVSGHRGDREVGVGPGYAIDDIGHEIVLTSSRTIAVPPVAGNTDGSARHYVLTVQYPDDDDLEEVETRVGICETRGAVRLREEPIFCWVALNPDGSPTEDQAEILRGSQLVLAEIAVRQCMLDDDIAITPRRDARPPTQPYIACGVEIPTGWKLWVPWESDGDEPVVSGAFHLAGGLRAWVDTTAAGFLTTPRFLARIDGDRVLTQEIDGRSTTFVVDGLLSVVDAGAAGFEAQVIVLQFAMNGHDDIEGGGAPALAREGFVELFESWRVGWMGVEG